jgi:predicted acylesterase/phospholipase RssA
MATDAIEAKTLGTEMPTRFKQRVLVLQGGGALGAYEAGAFRAFYDWLVMQTEEDENIFDVIAGTSIGAINASIIISHVKRKRESAGVKDSRQITRACWEGTADALDEFWLKKIRANPITSYWISTFWEKGPGSSFFPDAASAEAARKYYAAKESIVLGSPGVFSPVMPIYDSNYFDPFNTWFRSTNQRLKTSLEEFVKNFPLKTEADKNEPRLLTVAVDVATGKAVTFDSYSEKTEYTDTDYENQEPVVIKYKKGLCVEHVLASASVPINFDFQWIPLEYDYDDLASNRPLTPTDKRFRPFWDGGIKSNTPLSELLKAHRKFWMERIGGQKMKEYLWFRSDYTASGPLSSEKQSLVPNVDIYMINVWPDEIDRNYLPHNYDITQARQNDITFGDKTRTDQEVAEDTTDFGNLARRIREKVLDSKDELLKSVLKIKASTKDPTLLKDLQDKVDLLNGLEREIDKILDEDCNDHRSSESRERYEKFGDLLSGQFDVEKVLRVERQADKNAIFNMMLDFTEETIVKMRAQGRHDALQTIINNSIDLIIHILDQYDDSKAISEKEKEKLEKEKEKLGEQILTLKSLLDEALDTLGESTEDKEYNATLLKLEDYLQAYKQIEGSPKATMTLQTTPGKLWVLRY